MISPLFHHRYELFMGSNPLFGGYLRWVYQTTVDDLASLGVTLAPTHALLCGTSGARTSRAFCEHILAREPDARITILDIGEAQLEHSRRALQAHLPEASVTLVQADARQTGLAAGSIDHIDTDFIFVYLDHDGVDAMLAEWRRLLTPTGTVSFRVLATRSVFSRAASGAMNLWLRRAFRSDAHSHRLSDIEAALVAHGFRYRVTGHAFLPFGYRFVATPRAERP